MRIAIAGISHEALNTSPLPTTMEHFQVWRGQDLLQGENQFSPYAAGASTGAVARPKYATLADMMQDLGAEPVPILHANGLAPSGTVEQDTYLQLRDEIIDGIQQAGHWTASA